MASSLRLKEHLNRCELDVVICKDGYRGLGKVLHEPINGVVCGGIGIGIDGPALVAALKLNPKTSNIKTVLVTSSKHPKLQIQPDLLGQRTEEDFKKIALWFQEQTSLKEAS